MARCLALVLALAALALVAQPALAATRYEVLYLGNDNCTGVPDTIVSQPGKKQCTVDWETNCETLGKAGTDTYAAYCLNETLATSALVMPVYLLPTTVAMTVEYATPNCTGNVTIASGNRVAHCISYGAGEDVDDQDGGSGMFKCDENDVPFVVQFLNNTDCTGSKTINTTLPADGCAVKPDKKSSAASKCIKVALPADCTGELVSVDFDGTIGCVTLPAGINSTLPSAGYSPEPGMSPAASPSPAPKPSAAGALAAPALLGSALLGLLLLA